MISVAIRDDDEDPDDRVWVVNIHRIGPEIFIVNNGEGETSLVDRATLDQVLKRFIGGNHDK